MLMGLLSTPTNIFNFEWSLHLDKSDEMKWVATTRARDFNFTTIIHYTYSIDISGEKEDALEGRCLVLAAGGFLSFIDESHLPSHSASLIELINRSGL
jgi:hypothetical protein